MFAHIQLGARDIALMTRFYDEVLCGLGWLRVVDLRAVPPAGIVWRRGEKRWPQFVINTPLDGSLATSGNGSQVSFLAASTAAVDAAWKTALEMSGTDLGAPGLRARYADDFYAAYCRDPEGNKLCFVHTGAGGCRA